MTRRLTSTERRLRRLSSRRAVVRLPKVTGPRLWLGALAVPVLVVLAWAAFDLWSARRDLIVARQQVSQAATKLGDTAEATAATSLRLATREAVARTRRADDRARHSVGLRVAALVPGISSQRDGVLRATRTAREAAGIADDLAAVADREGAGITVRNGAVDVSAVRALASAADAAAERLDALPPAHGGAQWSLLADGTTALDEMVDDTAQRLAHGAGVMRVAADLLGADGPRRIFIALLNNAEMRDQGMVLSYATAETANGGFRITRSGSVLDIPVRRPITDVAVPAGTRTIFGPLEPTRLWQSVNATADTSLSGALMRSMYKSATGDDVDGVIALDVPALSALLSVTGPLQVSGIEEPLTAENAGQILLDDLYEVAPGQSFAEARSGRLEQLAATVAAVADHIRNSPVNGASLVRALGNAARGGHAWVSTADPVGQRALENAGLVGAPGRVHPERTIHVAAQNGTATKLDWFVDPVVDVKVTLTPDGSAVVKTNVRVPNTAPVPTPSSEQYGPDGVVTRVPGLYRGRVYFWGPITGDQLDSVEDSGLRVNFKVLDVPAGGEASASFATVVPRAVRDGELQLRFVPQPRARPMRLRVSVSGAGWSIEDTHSRAVDWDRTLEMSWSARRR